jgi:hypothetical protein
MRFGDDSCRWDAAQKERRAGASRLIGRTANRFRIYDDTAGAEMLAWLFR